MVRAIRPSAPKNPATSRQIKQVDPKVKRRWVDSRHIIKGEGSFGFLSTSSNKHHPNYSGRIDDERSNNWVI